MAQGSIRQRGKRWYIVYPYHAPDGSYKRKWERAIDVGFPDTKRGAEQALRQRLSEVDSGHNPAPARITVAEYLLTWHAGRREVRSSTHYNEGRRIHTRIIPYIGDIELDKLTRTDLRAWHAALLDDGLKASSVGHMHRTLSTALNSAVEDRLIRANPASKLRTPRSEPEQIQVWDEDQIAAFLDACQDDQYGTLWQLIIMTGLRRGEAIALRWSDVDLPNARLTVNQTIVIGRDGKRTIGPPKTRSSHRSVNLPGSLVAALRAERDRQAFMREQAGSYWRDEDWVFTRSDGSMIVPYTAARALKRLAEGIGLPPLTMHQLRHTHATWLIGRKVNPKVVSERLGHSRVGITLDTYTHVTATMQSEVADVLDGPLGSKTESNVLYPAQES